MTELKKKLCKLEYSDFYNIFAIYILEQALSKQWQIEYFSVMSAGSGELLVIVKVNGKTKKYSIPVINVIDFEACNNILNKLSESGMDNVMSLIYKMVR